MIGRKRSIAHRRRRLPTVRTVGASALLVATLFAPFGSVAGQEVTAQDLVDAILAGDGNPMYDLDGDGAVDVADIVCLTNNCHRPASFQTIEQVVSEGAGVVNVTVEFPIPVTTTLYISVDDDGTADFGSDFTPPAASFPVAGVTSVVVPVPILNDGEVGEVIEIVTLVIEPGAGYQVGAFNRHTIFIEDDDAVWRGVVETGRGRVSLAMEIKNDDGTHSAKITSDGIGSFPIGSWDATGVVFTDTQFNANVAPIPMPAPSTDLGLAFTRQLSFQAADSRICEDGVTPCATDAECTAPDLCRDDEIVSSAILLGSYTETTAFPNASHLDRVASGVFSLQRVVTPDLRNVPLTPAP